MKLRVVFLLASSLVAGWLAERFLSAGTEPTLHFSLAGGAAAASGLPHPVGRAELVDRFRSNQPLAEDAAFFFYEERATYRIDLEQGGNYTVYGTSANNRSEPLELTVNGVRVSSNAFWNDTGSRDAPFETHRLARNVAFSSGSNEIVLSGVAIEERDFALSLAPVRSRGVLSTLLSASILFGLTSALWPRRAPGGASRAGRRLVASLVAATLLLLGLPLFLYLRHGRDLVALGTKNRELVERVTAFESYLESAEHRGNRAARFSVAVLGDSTHYWELEPTDWMPEQLARALPAGERGRFEIYGFSSGGLAVWDYYMLLNRLVEEKPDLLVLPVNATTFAGAWLDNQGYRFPYLERFLRWPEAAHALSLGRVGERIAPHTFALRRLDLVATEGRGEPLLRGIKIYSDRERARIEENLTGRWPSFVTPVPEQLATANKVDDAEWVGSPRRYEELLPVFRRVNEIAAEGQIPILYYAVPEQSTAEGGIGVTTEDDWATIESEVVGESGNRFVRITSRIPPQEFHDDWIHLTAEGLAIVARELAGHVLAMRDRGGKE